MTIPRDELIASLKEITYGAIAQANDFRQLPGKQLNRRNSPNSWSILECFEHLNRYGNFYLPEMEKRIKAAPKDSGAIAYKPGLLGNYFAGLMRGHNGKIRTLKTPNDMNPLNSVLTMLTMDRFQKQCDQLIALLDQGAGINLTKTKTSISLTPLIRLRLGDTFRFYTYHIERHVRQAQHVNAG